MQSKLELLLQDNNLKDEQVQSILLSVTALRRLSNLNEGLLLLAKIENNQYEPTEEIRLTIITKKYLRLFDEFIQEKQLTVNTTFNGEFTSKLHPILADSLITNLLGNAIKYNYEGGNIDIIVSAEKYQISNSSMLKPIPDDKLFIRMNTSKESHKSSNGLGLAIVKKIADVNHLQITYHAQIGMHSFKIIQKCKI